MSSQRKQQKGCGCSGGTSADKTTVPPGSHPSEERASIGKRFARPLRVPAVSPRIHIHERPEALSEVRIVQPGTIPVTVVVPTRSAKPDLVKQLEESIQDFPHFQPKNHEGAVDIVLENIDGTRLKEGTVVLENAGRTISVPIDRGTRRFRTAGLKPGTYLVRASSSSGRSQGEVEVREGDVSRVALQVDGDPPKGVTDLRFAIEGSVRAVKVVATDQLTGEVVFDRLIKPEAGVLHLKEVPFGKFHWHFGDAVATSCYDNDVNDLTLNIDVPRISLKATIDPSPNPPDPRFKNLPLEFQDVARALPELGVRSIEELAAAEPEGLMHRAQAKNYKGFSPIHDRLFARAIEAARTSIGVMRSIAPVQTMFRLSKRGVFSQQLNPQFAGQIEISVDLGPAGQGEFQLQKPTGIEKHKINGSVKIQFNASTEEIAGGKGYQLTVHNQSERSVSGSLQAVVPTDRFLPGFVPVRPSVKEMIEDTLRALSVRNPGLGTVVPDAIMAPQNIQMWIDRAKTFMANAGVCSMNDLGRLRVNPMQILRPGAYVAPADQPPSFVPPLAHYEFSSILGNSALHYLPNDVLHDTAVVLAGQWDIRGQAVVIGKEVRELEVIVGSILYDGASRITWETAALPGANSYWPNPAPSGPSGVGAGEAGQDGKDGDREPHPSQNGGANAVTEGPIVTMYILDATNNVPPIDLRGQDGGAGGPGQDGGRGGDGAQGLRADGTFFGGCCRGAGFGGNGGQGGDGGRGGKGGTGGRGGRVTILTTPPGITTFYFAPPAIDVNPGPGGPGGTAGNPAPGGFGGPAGSADCETWCDDHPERRGGDGPAGSPGEPGFSGDAGPTVLEDQVQFLPITEEQWNEEFNKPHILDIAPDDAEPGETVTVTGQNFNVSIDRVYFDGTDVGPVTSATQATFVVPLDTEGGYHPVVVRASGATDRRSNRALLRIIPKVDEIVAGTRWLENQSINLSGLAFRPGLQVLAEDRSVSPPSSSSLPVVGVARTSINLQVPGGFLGNLRGVKRIVVRNPDGGTSRDERVVRISDTIVVRCTAFRVVGTTPGVGTSRSATDIANLFLEGAVNSVSIPWAQARIAFRLVQPVQTISVTDDLATTWPIVDTATDMTTFNSAPGVLGTLNFFFVRDVELATAYSYFGGGPLFIGDEGSSILGPVDFQQVVAHEIGHSLCLRHICDGGGDGPGTFFNRNCDDGDEAFLMYPFWDVSDGMTIPPAQIDSARLGATHLEDGKTASLPVTSLFQLTEVNPQCLAADAQN